MNRCGTIENNQWNSGWAIYNYSTYSNKICSGNCACTESKSKCETRLT